MPLAVRRRAARGELSLSPGESIATLAQLTSDPDVEIRTLAQRTLEGWDRRELSSLLSDPATPPSVLNLVLELPGLSRDDLLDAVFRNLGLAGHERDMSQSPVAPPATQTRATALATASTGGGGGSASQRVEHMTVSERIRAALMGGPDERAILIRDPNRAVAKAALMSPKLSEQEAEAFASMTNVSEDVLRAIAGKRAFTRSYAVVRSLANNPRVPIDAALPLLARLNQRDLRALSVNHNVADVVRHAAAKLLQSRTSP